MYKEGPENDISNCQAICLRTDVYKTPFIISLWMLKMTLDRRISDSQKAFRKGRRQAHIRITPNRGRHRGGGGCSVRRTHVCLDLKAAFDTLCYDYNYDHVII